MYNNKILKRRVCVLIFARNIFTACNCHLGRRISVKLYGVRIPVMFNINNILKLYGVLAYGNTPHLETHIDKLFTVRLQSSA